MKQAIAQVDGRYRLGGSGFVRELAIDGDVLSTVSLNVGGRRFDIEDARELAVVLDRSTWRQDIATWRWRAIAAGDEADFAGLDVDDSSWQIVPHLHPVFDSRTDEISWFRTPITIPGRHAGDPLWLVIGGLDHEDWSSYEVFLAGRMVDAWTNATGLREPRRIDLGSGSKASPIVRFDEPMILALRVHGLDRSGRVDIPGEIEHFFHQGWLLDQFLAAGDPVHVVDDFQVECSITTGDGQSLDVQLRSESLPSLHADLAYRVDEHGVHKVVNLRNEGTNALAVLDVIGDDFRTSEPTSGGGRGQPAVIGNQMFAGVEHPAGVNFAVNGQVRLVQMPGISIAPGTNWRSQSFVIGGRPDRAAAAAFQDYVRDLRPRPTTRTTVYSPLGWYDFTNPADPLPELTSDLVTTNLERLREFHADGVAFDIYMFDDWCDPSDLGSFRRRSFPDGPNPLVAAVRDIGMEPGLWWATTRALWSAGETPGIEPAFANAPEFGAPVALAAGEWRWLTEFGNLFIGERRLCLAAEPYRTMYLTAIPAHVERLGIALLKLDCAVLHCTSSDHGHRPGRHSVEAMVDALEGLIERCRAARPDIRIVWYWGFRSPWFLRFGEMVFDKGLLMEAATASSAPLPTTRQAMSLNVDQSIEYSPTLPLELQDSLGIWIGDVAWCNRVGREEWREAFLLDVARGSDLVQLWGDLGLLDAEDRRFLGQVLRWVARHGSAGSATARVGGNPWATEAYGYARPADGGTLLTLVNPSWNAARYAPDRSLPGWPEGPATILELYPNPGSVDEPDGLRLAPFALRVLSVIPAGGTPSSRKGSAQPVVRPTRTVDVGPIGALSREPGKVAVAAAARLRLPDIYFGDVLFVRHRLMRDGAWRYDPEPQSLIDFRAGLDGLSVRQDTIPRHRDRNGPGSSWVIRRIPAGPAWSGRELSVDVTSRVPVGTTVLTDAVVVDAWWLRKRRTFADLLAPDHGET